MGDVAIQVKTRRRNNFTSKDYDSSVTNIGELLFVNIPVLRKEGLSLLSALLKS